MDPSAASAIFCGAMNWTIALFFPLASSALILRRYQWQQRTHTKPTVVINF
jgi:hypothetical protein